MTGPRAVRVLRDGHPAGSIEMAQDRLVIRLPDPRLLRLVARSVLVAAAILSFPCLRSVLHDGAAGGLSSAHAAPYDFTGSVEEDDTAYMLMLFGDMKRHGLLKAEDRAVFVGDPGSGMLFLKRRRIDPISEQLKWKLGDHSVDFVFVANGSADPYFGFTDRVLKVGGIAAVRLGGEQCRLPANYRIVYIRRFGSTFVAMKKIAHANANANASAVAGANVADSVGTRIGRRLLSIVTEGKNEAMRKPEKVIYELPALKRNGKYWERARSLPDLIMDLLDVYVKGLLPHSPRPATAAKIEEWSKKYNLEKNQAFEIIRVAVSEKRGAKRGGITEWFVGKVRGGEYAVMKAKAELVKEMVRERAIVLVDELLLECSQRLENKKAYWKCLALYGKLKDEGVAAHTWKT